MLSRLQPELAGGDAGHLQEVADEPRELRDLPFDDRARLLLDQVLVALLQTHQLQGIEDRRQRIAQLVREHGQELVLAAVEVGHGDALLPGLPLEPAAHGDVADIALNDVAGVRAVGVADELHLHVGAAARLERQVLVADVAGLPQLPEGRLAGSDVIEQADLPEFLAQQLVVAVPEQRLDEGIGVDDPAARRVEDQDAVLGRLEEPPVAHFAGAQRGRGGEALGHVLDDQQDLARAACRARQAAAGEVHGPASGTRQLLLDLEALEALESVSARQDPRELLPQPRDVPLAVRELGEVTALRILPRDLERLAEGAARGAHPELLVEHQEGLPEGVDEALGGSPPVAVPAGPVRREWSTHRPFGARFGTRARLAIKAWLGNAHIPLLVFGTASGQRRSPVNASPI